MDFCRLLQQRLHEMMRFIRSLRLWRSRGPVGLLASVLLLALHPVMAQTTPTAWNEGLNASWLRMEMPIAADARLSLAAQPASVESVTGLSAADFSLDYERTADAERWPDLAQPSVPSLPPPPSQLSGLRSVSDAVFVLPLSAVHESAVFERDDQPLWPAFASPFHLGFDVERDRVRPVRLVLDEAGKRTDLSVFDMQHNFEVFSKGYGGLFKELRVLIVNREDLLPVFSLYRPSSDLCYLGINRSERQWRRLTEKLNLFDPSDELTVIQEIAAAHEVGHCVAGSYLSATNQRWSIAQRELFADIFALLHIQVQFADNDLDRFNAFNQLARFRAGGPKDATGPSPRQLAAIFDVMEEEGVTLLGAVGAIDLLVERVVGLMGVAETK